MLATMCRFKRAGVVAEVVEESICMLQFDSYDRRLRSL